ncbi:LapA family protein [Blastococcus sp. TBT05-19]|uniref:LapA family protein n=1 Tax=Blastococcus sp. TBT05-19 TaxID=2250581 RepID=UPI000DE80863|nr:LapA family protein [Blastococcus sp. TBT05-19]RBY92062.1 LapA family protein [Blastococcus sp. TBT05-19]
MSAPTPPPADDPLRVVPPSTTATPTTGGTGPAPDRPAPDRPAPQQAPARQRHTGKTIGRSLALALLLFVTVVLVLFVVFNDQTVPISLVFGDVEAPLVVALLIAAALGGLLVWLAGLVRRARRRNR